MTDQEFNTIPDEIQERWLPIPDFPGYEVSDQGRVRSYWRSKGATPGTQGEIPGGRFIAPIPQRILQGSLGRGYRQLSLRKDGRKHCFKIHALVLTIFIGPRPPGMECCHNDGVRINNRLTNLRWDTCKNNHRDQVSHGTNPSGERSSLSKLTETQVVEIRELYIQGYSYQKLSEMFLVTKGTIAAIMQQRTWTHLL